MMDRKRRMFAWLTSLPVLTVLILSGCADDGEVDVGRLEATIVQEDGRHVLVSDSTGTRYIPNRIPLSYREDGLQVLASGRTRGVDANGDSLITLTSLVSREKVESLRTETVP